MNQCALPGWNTSHCAGVVLQDGEVDLLHDPTFCSDEVAELIWDNGQLALHGLGALLQPAPAKSSWGRSSDTLECIVRQATCTYPLSRRSDEEIPVEFGDMSIASSSKKRLCSEMTRMKATENQRSQGTDDHNSSLSAGATVFRDDNDHDADAAAMASCNSLPNLKATTVDADLDNREQEDNHANKTARRRRTAAVHNLSEKKRRERINQKMRTLQKLVPNASKTDKASMLDEVIEYMKQLQAQIYVMDAVRNAPPQMMMPMGMQHQFQMSVMAARMGMFDMQPFSPFIHPAMVAAPSPTPVVVPIAPRQSNREPQAPSRDPYSKRS